MAGARGSYPARAFDLRRSTRSTGHLQRRGLTPTCSCHLWTNTSSLPSWPVSVAITPVAVSGADVEECRIAAMRRQASTRFAPRLANWGPRPSAGTSPALATSGGAPRDAGVIALTIERSGGKAGVTRRFERLTGPDVASASPSSSRSARQPERERRSSRGTASIGAVDLAVPGRYGNDGTRPPPLAAA
jgi:hypothetical protein